MKIALPSAQGVNFSVIGKRVVELAYDGEPFVDVCHVAVHDWYHRLEHLFEPDRDRREAATVDETECEGNQETCGDRSLIEAWFSVLKYRTMPFRHRFPHYSTRESTESWLTAFAALHNAMLQS